MKAQRQHLVTRCMPALLAISALIASCGDSSSGGGCTTSAECGNNQVCFEGFCQAKTVTTDDTTGADGGVSDTPAPTDTPLTDATGDVKPDTGAKDAGPDTKTDVADGPPAIKTISPTDGQVNVDVPLQIVITFTESVKIVTKDTIELKDALGKLVTCTYASDASGAVWTIKPQGDTLLASPYKLAVNSPLQAITDSAGNKMQGIKNFTFYTKGPANTSAYDALAAKYAPTINLGTNGAHPEFDFPLAFDLDANWYIFDNKKHVQKSTVKELKPVVYHAVIESESHTYIHYTYYFTSHTEGTEYLNEAAGALVVLEKWPAERPVEILTWYRDSSGSEYVRAFQTSESGIVQGDGKTMTQKGIDGTIAQATLFPSSRFLAYIPSGKHESCLWESAGFGNIGGCDLPVGDKAGILKMVLTYDAAGGTIAKNGAIYPKDGAFKYGLVDLLTSLWLRRLDTSDVFYDSDSKFTLSMGGKTYETQYPKYFIADKDASGATQSDGRAPFAVTWKPGDGGQFTDISQGTYFFDPAGFLMQRHDSDYVNKAFDAAAKTGFSKVYCYNPYLGIDQRSKSAVCP